MTRKVVINDCYGGFGLSPAGISAYLARQGKQAYFYIQDRDESVPYSERDCLRVSQDQAADSFMFTTLTEDIGERVGYNSLWPDGNYHPAYFNDDKVARDDPDLVAIVEENQEVGKYRKISGDHASLKVVEIPVDVKWTICEYDGIEWVAEEHRTWE